MTYHLNLHYLLLVLQRVWDLLQAADEEGCVKPLPAVSAHGSQPVAPLVQGPDVGQHLQLPAHPDEVGRVLVHQSPPLGELSAAQLAHGVTSLLMRGTRIMSDFKRSVLLRLWHHQEHAGLLKRLPQGADPEGDLPRDRRAQFQPVCGEDRRSSVCLLLDSSQPEIRGATKMLENVQPFARKVRGVDHTAGKHISIGHESTFTASFEHQHVIIKGGPVRQVSPFSAAVHRGAGSSCQRCSGR